MTCRPLTAAMTALAILLVLGGSFSSAEEPTSPTGAVPVVDIPNPEYHAGTLARGEEASVVYTVKNRGTADLRLVRAEGSCSCIRTTILRPVIPPGEEGGVEVSYLDHSAAGETTRVIDVTTNDPRNRTTRLTFSALVEVPFDFEAHELAMGTIYRLAREPVSKHAVILFTDPENAQPVDLISSSPLVTADTLGPGEPRSGHQSLEILVTVQPGLPPGPLLETITAVSGDHPPATLRVTGMITGDVGVTPTHLKLMVVETVKREARDDWKRIYLRGYDPERPLKVFRCRDSNEILDLELVELIPGEKFELTATLKAGALAENSEISGTIEIATNSRTKEVVTVSYDAVRRLYHQLDQNKAQASPETDNTAGKDVDGEETPETE